MNASSQRGSAIIWVLIATALFAAVGFAVLRNSNTSTNLLTNEQARTHAQRIVAYSNDLQQAVKRLHLRGCSDTEISFANNDVAGYDNPNSVDNESCHVFNTKGGGISWQNPDISFLEDKNKSQNGFGKYFFSNTIQVKDIGTDCGDPSCTDLVMTLPFVDPVLCQTLNEILGLEVDLTASEKANNVNHIDNKKFRGEYTFSSAGEGSIFGEEGVMPAGKMSGCFWRGTWSAGGNPYEYYQVLLSR